MAAVSLTLPQNKMSIGHGANCIRVRVETVAGRNPQTALVCLLDQPDTQRIVIWHVAVRQANFVAGNERYYHAWAEDQAAEP